MVQKIVTLTVRLNGSQETDTNGIFSFELRIFNKSEMDSNQYVC